MIKEEKVLQNFGRSVLRTLLPGIKTPRVEIFFLSGREMLALKKRFYPRKKPKFVDVLSFPEIQSFPQPRRPGTFLGEIYLNKIFLKKPPVVLKYYFLHGLLHLLGYEHESRNDIMEMRRLEEKFLGRRPE